MSKDNEMTDIALKIVKEYSVSAQKVYEAWVDPERMVHWMFPKKVTCDKAEIDLRIGGEYRICFTDKEGVHIAVGKYREIIPNEKLVFTWSWEGKDMPETLVTLHFEAKGSGSQLTLLHEHFCSQDLADKHYAGHSDVLVHLGEFLTRD